MIVLVACTRAKIIPDSKLTLVFKDIYLSNAYVGQMSFRTDSVDIYAPILAQYGFKPRDLNYTLNDFSKRKSSRITDIIEDAIAMLEEDLLHLNSRVAMLDSMDRIAAERYMRVVYADSLIRVTRIADTARLRIEIPASEGKYRIEYYFRIDSLDQNKSLRATHALRDEKDKLLANSTNWMRTGEERKKYETTLIAPADAHTLEILLANYGKEMKKPHLQIDSLTVAYYLPQAQAMDSLRRSLFRHTLRINGIEEYPYLPTDSSTLSLHAPWLPEERDTDD